MEGAAPLRVYSLSPLGSGVLGGSVLSRLDLGGSSLGSPQPHSWIPRPGRSVTPEDPSRWYHAPYGHCSFLSLLGGPRKGNPSKKLGKEEW